MDKKLKASGVQPFTLKSIMCVLLLVGAVTGANIWWSPPRESPAPAPEYERFFDYDFSFVHLKGMNFTAVGSEGENATENGGCLYGVLESEDQPSEEIIVVWSLAAPDLCLEEALESAFMVADRGNASYTRGQCVNSSRGDHELLYEFYNISDPEVGDLSGIVGVWYCNLTRRVFTVHLVSPSGTTNKNDLQTHYLELMDSFMCHFYRPKRTWSSRPSLYDVSDLITVSTMIFLCIGFTFTYMMDGFLNFAHTTYAGIGSIVNSYLVRFWGFNPYDTWPFAALVGGVLGMFLYVGLVRPIGTHSRDWNRAITLTFAFWVVAMILGSVAYTFSYWDHIAMIDFSGGVVSRRYDFYWYGLPGRYLIGILYCVIFVVGLHLFLKRTRFGIALRATAEDEDLAAILGVDPFRVHLASWFISGALSALAGAIFNVGRGMGGGGSDAFFISVMTGSIVGGLNSIYGAIFGGIFVSMAQKTLNYVLLYIFGISMNAFVGLMPIILLWMVLFVAPNGITGFKGSPINLLYRLRAQIKRSKSNIIDLLKRANNDTDANEA